MGRISREFVTTIDLVRHAHADWAPYERRPLSGKGLRDAVRLVQLLSSEFGELIKPVTTILSSPSLRARQTVSPLARHLGLPVVIEPDLRERRLASEAVAPALFRETVRATWQDPDFRLPGGETNRMAQSRGLAAIAALQKSYAGEHIVAATHGNLLSLILQHYDRSVDFNFWSALAMPDVYRLSVPARGSVEVRRIWDPTGS